MIDNIRHFFDWLFYYRRGRIKYWIYDYGDSYLGMASDGNATVCNCYGSTKEAAKEMAVWKLTKLKERV